MGMFLELSIRLLMILSMFFGDYLPIINHNYSVLCYEGDRKSSFI